MTRQEMIDKLYLWYEEWIHEGGFAQFHPNDATSMKDDKWKRLNNMTTDSMELLRDSVFETHPNVTAPKVFIRERFLIALQCASEETLKELACVINNHVENKKQEQNEQTKH